MGYRMSWPEIRINDHYRGRWVALDDCTYDSRTGQPSSGSVVDADEDLVVLCNRMREKNSRHCAILFCEDEDEAPESSTRRN